MKNLFFFIACSILAPQLGFCLIETVPIYPNQIHVPLGFDSNDQAEIIVHGLLPDTCHRRPSGKVEVRGNEIHVEMKADKVSGSQVYCIKAMVPYLVSVPLGKLPEGAYKIAVNTIEPTTYKMVVDRPGSASIDNFTYANVTNVTKDEETGELIISGEHPSNCMELTKIEIIANETHDTFSVMPIVMKTGDDCNLVMTPFKVQVPFMAPAGGVVFHVRRLDGTAVNFHWN